MKQNQSKPSLPQDTENALHIAVLETSGALIAIPYGIADRANTVIIEGIIPDRSTTVALTLGESTYTLCEGEKISLGAIGLCDGTHKAKLSIERKGRGTAHTSLSLGLIGDCLCSPQEISPVVLAQIISELTRLKLTNRKMQKRLRAIERSLGGFAWI